MPGAVPMAARRGGGAAGAGGLVLRQGGGHRPPRHRRPRQPEATRASQSDWEPEDVRSALRVPGEVRCRREHDRVRQGGHRSTFPHAQSGPVRDGRTAARGRAGAGARFEGDQRAGQGYPEATAGRAAAGNRGWRERAAPKLTDAATETGRGQRDVPATDARGAPRAGPPLPAALGARAQRDRLPPGVRGRPFLLPGVPRLGGQLARRMARALRPVAASEERRAGGVKKGSRMDIKRTGTQPSRKGPAEYFTGTVRIDPLFQSPEPARVSGGSVTFEPGARTAWHTHPLGQTLSIIVGLGWVQREGGPIEEVRPGDVVWFPPGLKHWHGATPTTAMTHIAIQESLDGKNVDWMEKVNDDQ